MDPLIDIVLCQALSKPVLVMLVEAGHGAQYPQHPHPVTWLSSESVLVEHHSLESACRVHSSFRTPLNLKGITHCSPPSVQYIVGADVVLMVVVEVVVVVVVVVTEAVADVADEIADVVAVVAVGSKVF